MNSSEIRKQFHKYFTQQKHTWIPSSSLIPSGDSSLLFVNAGMNQFKDIFLGVHPPQHPQVCSIQKCLRAGGKHNDLDQVGRSPFHHTFFEMMGYFSFGSYFKAEAIHYAFEFLTKHLHLPMDQLWISVLKEDVESAHIWQKHHLIPKEKILLMNENTNFWRMGDTGPCGPCSEIYFNPNPENTKPKLEDLIEIWNLVFMDFNENEQGERKPLPTPCIDTGMGFERISMVLQGKKSNYDTDIFSSILRDLKKQHHTSCPTKEEQLSLRVLADHSRAIAFLIADNIKPSNEGRAYILRRIIRRASYYEHKIDHSARKSLVEVGVSAVINQLKSVYPELEKQKNQIQEIVQQEQKLFLNNLERGKQMLLQKIQLLQKKGNHTLDGHTVFTLYDTYGFPFDLTKVIAIEQGMQIDSKEFKKKMEESKKQNRMRSKKNIKQINKNNISQEQEKFLQQQNPSCFTGYDTLIEKQACLKGWFITASGKQKPLLESGESAWVVFDSTPFYPEGGGQVGDQGTISKQSALAKVTNCSLIQNITIHEITVLKGSFQTGDICQLEVNSQRRKNITIHHSSTHLLHSALKKVLGTIVKQAGSLVNEEKLRFDFTFDRPMSNQEIVKVEKLINQWVSESWPVKTKHMKKEEALISGAIAFFQDKYSDSVRVLEMSPHSLELCGGTHVTNTAHILYFMITQHTGVGAGVKRIEAIAGHKAQHTIHTIIQNQRKAYELLNISSPITNNNNLLLTKIQNQQKELKNCKKSMKSSASSLESFEKTNSTFHIQKQEYTCVFNQQKTNNLPINALRLTAEDLKNQLTKQQKEGIIFSTGLKNDNKTPLVIACTKNCSLILPANKLMKTICQNLGGTGGGRNYFAQGVTHADSFHLKQWIQTWLNEYETTLPKT